MSPRWSLRTHLFAATSAVVAISLGITLLVGGVLTRREVQRATLLDLSHQADLIAARERTALLPLARIKELLPDFKRQDEIPAIASLARPSKYLSQANIVELRRNKSLNGTVDVDGKTYFYAARKVGPKALVLLRPKKFAVGPYLEGFGIAALVAGVLAALASFLLARRIAGPVGRVAEASRRLAGPQTPPPVPVEGAAELAALAKAFNEAAAELARARAAERQFLLSVSHELKTPLTAIRGYAEGLGDGAFGADEAAATIAREASRLERLVGDLLDLARMNRSEFSVHRASLDLSLVAREVVSRYEGQARAFEVTLDAFAPTHAPAIGDGDRILQVASNLVENALRLTPPGGVVRVTAEPGLLAVEDSGPGLAPDDLPHAFERFYLYSRYGNERPVGTGLGLAIVKELTEGMGGRVEVESEPGRGARFTVRLEVPQLYERITSREPTPDSGRPLSEATASRTSPGRD
ncbi:MAG: HAMP domain-containing sensor histidine kinase [Gaiellaceae bacterium]